MGLKLVHIGTGAFRRVYRIKNTDLVMKFPESDPDYKESHAWDKRHSTAEVRKIEYFKQFKSLKTLVPEVYYHDRKTGVLVMEYCGTQASERNLFWALASVTSKIIKELAGKTVADYGQHNMRINKHGQLKFIDLGY